MNLRLSEAIFDIPNHDSFKGSSVILSDYGAILAACPSGR